MKYVYNSQIRNYTIAFGRLFSDISIRRVTEAGELSKTFKVPLTYASKQKFYHWLKQGPVSDTRERPVAIMLPRIAFVMSGIDYDPERTINKTLRFHKTSLGTDSDGTKMMYPPIPYNIHFSVSVWSRYSEEHFQILEQIVPLFTPAYMLKFKELPSTFNRTVTVPLTLNSIDFSDEYEMDESGLSIRLQMWTLDFTMKGQFYPPIRDAKVIKDVLINTHGYTEDEIDEEKIYYSDQFTVTPFDSLETDEYTIEQVHTTYDENKDDVSDQNTMPGGPSDGGTIPFP